MSSGTQHHLLVVSHDPTLTDEVESALSSGLKQPPIVHAAADLTSAVDLTRNLSPKFAIVEAGGGLEQFKSYLREIQAAEPETLVAGTYHPRDFEEGQLGNLFVEGIRTGAQDFLQRPVSSHDLRQFVERHRVQPSGRRTTSGTTVAFLSNKGGVGKSTLAVNSATRLAQRHPGEVLLIDASLQMGVCAPMLNLRPETTLLDAIRARRRLDSTLIRQLAIPHVSGLELLAAPPDAVSAIEINEQFMSRVLNLARRTYRYVIIDTFPLFDGVVMSVLDTADLAYIVLDNVVPTVLSIRSLLELLNELGHPPERQRVAVNRMTSVTGNPSQRDIETTIGRDVDYVFPYDKRVLTSANLGEPFALNRPWWSTVEKSLSAMVDEIEAHDKAPPGEQSQIARQGVSQQSTALDDHFTEERSDV